MTDGIRPDARVRSLGLGIGAPDSENSQFYSSRPFMTCPALLAVCMGVGGGGAKGPRASCFASLFVWGAFFRGLGGFLEV